MRKPKSHLQQTELDFLCVSDGDSSSKSFSHGAELMEYFARAIQLQQHFKTLSIESCRWHRLELDLHQTRQGLRSVFVIAQVVHTLPRL